MSLPIRYSIPALDRQAGSGWINTTDTLRAKRQKDQNIFDWRRQAPVRPVVFRDPNKVTDEVVQLHLEHPVVQRLLQRFLSQGFVLTAHLRATAPLEITLKKPAPVGSPASGLRVDGHLDGFAFFTDNISKICKINLACWNCRQTCQTFRRRWRILLGCR